MDIRKIDINDIMPVKLTDYRHGEKFINALEFKQVPDTIIPIQIGDVIDIQTGDGTCRIIVIQVDSQDCVGIVWKA